MTSDTTQAQLEMNLKNCQSFFEVNSDGIAGLDVYGHIFYVNPALQRMVGYSGDVIKQQGISLFFEQHHMDLVLSKLEQALNGQLTDAEYTILHQSGRKIAVLATNVPIVVDNKTIGLYVVLKDNTERRKMMEELRRSQELLSQAQSLAHLGSWERDYRTNQVLWSEEMYRICAEEPESSGEFTDYIQRFLHPDDREFVQDALEKSMKGIPYNIEYRLVRSDGSVRYVHSMGNVLFDDAGQPLRMIGAALDITERKDEKLLLKESQLRYRSLMHNNPDGVLCTDLNGKIVDANASCLDMLGYDLEELLQVHPLDLATAEDAAAIHTILCPTLKSGNVVDPIEASLIHKQGNLILASIKSVPIIVHDQMVGSYTIVKDITQQKETERLLQESEAKYRLIAENMSDYVIMVDLNGIIEYSSPSSIFLTGFLPEDYIGSSVFDWFSPDSLNLVHTTFLELYSQKISHSTVEVRLKHKQGGYVTIESRGKAVLHANGNIEKFVFSGRDISDRKLVEEALRRSEQSLAYAQKVAYIGSWDRDLKTDENYWSEELYSILGTNPKEFKPKFKSYLDFVHPDDQQAVITTTRNLLLGESFNIEYRIIRSDGSIRFVHSFAKLLFDDAGEALRMIGTIQDVTERKHTDELLRNSDKLRVTGQLAAGVAHEIRNPLTAVKGFIELMQAGTSKPHYFKVILNEIRRIESIISEFLMLAKPQDSNYKNLNLKDLLAGTVTLLNTQAILNNVQILLKQNSPVPAIVCDENQLKQVFINLIKNAIEAMPNGGTIEIELEQKDMDHVLARITDQGYGIPKDRMAKLAEPFYSTKEKGTGLGLMICYKIIEEHHGQIQFQSELNQGTSVEITFPIV